MELTSWLMVGFLGGAFLFGIWFMLVREDDSSSRTMTIQRQDLTRRGAPDFSQAHNEFDRKLAEVERHLSSKRRDEQGWAQCKVDWLEDDLHIAKVAWDKKMNAAKIYSDEIRVDWLKPVSPKWLQNVMTAYGEYENERRTENG